MRERPHLHVLEQPELRSPLLLAAFSGWNDAGRAATFALRSLQKSWHASRFAEIDSEEFYDFTETRPRVVLTPAGQRSLEWPSNIFYAHRLPDADRDIVLLIGAEPQLRWRTFTEVIRHVANELDVSCLVTCGAMLADVPHTMEPRVTGFTSSHDGLPELRSLKVNLSTYEGPTGIVGVLHDAWRSTGLPAVSLWSNVPHYISAAPNPQAALALMSRVGLLLKVELPLGPLETHSVGFRKQIDEALTENPEAQEYVRQLETHYISESSGPVAPELIQELENFLKIKRPPGDANDT